MKRLLMYIIPSGSEVTGNMPISIENEAWKETALCYKLKGADVITVAIAFLCASKNSLEKGAYKKGDDFLCEQV